MMHALYHMPIGWLMLAIIAALTSGGFFAGRRRAEHMIINHDQRLHSRPNTHGYYVAMWTFLSLMAAFILYILVSEPIVRSILARELVNIQSGPKAEDIPHYIDRIASASASGSTSGDGLFLAAIDRYSQLHGAGILLGVLGTILAGLAGLFFARRRVSVAFRARNKVENGIQFGLLLCAAIAIATTAGIVLSLFFETLHFFSRPEVSITNFLFGTEWNAQTNASFGAIPLFFGTFMIALIAMVVAAPIGLFSAIYLSEYAGPRVRGWAKPLLEILAGIPTVVYGFFALLVVAPLIRQAGLGINQFLMDAGLSAGPVLAAQPTSALAAGLVMGIMIIPFVSSLSDDVINAVPQTLRDGAYAMGATKSETVKHVVMPAALPGVISALLLAVSRAIGETMIVVMAAGGRALITMDPTSDLTTITYQIVSLLTGDSEFDSPKTLSAFALGFVLFLVTLVFNLIALRVVQKYREKYD